MRLRMSVCTCLIMCEWVDLVWMFEMVYDSPIIIDRAEARKAEKSFAEFDKSKKRRTMLKAMQRIWNIICGQSEIFAIRIPLLRFSILVRRFIRCGGAMAKWIWESAVLLCLWVRVESHNPMMIIANATMMTVMMTGKQTDFLYMLLQLPYHPISLTARCANTQTYTRCDHSSLECACACRTDRSCRYWCTFHSP